jgi:hypothetical protein
MWVKTFVFFPITDRTSTDRRFLLRYSGNPITRFVPRDRLL